MSKYLRFFLIAMFVSGSLLAQTEIPYKQYQIAGLLKNPQPTNNDRFVVFQEDVPGYEIEHDIILADLEKKIYYAITTDHKSSYITAYPNYAVDPTGVWVLYYSFRYNKNGIYAQNIWTGEILTITLNADPYFLCSWSPDGNKILFVEDTGGVNAPTTEIKVYDMKWGETTTHKLPGTLDETMVRGYSNPVWSQDGNTIYYHTYLSKGGDHVMAFDMKANKLSKLAEGSNPGINRTTGEVVYLNHGGVVGYDPVSKASRIIFNTFPVTKDENSFFVLGKKGNHILISAVVAQFSTGNDRKNLFIVDLNSLQAKEIKFKDKSVLNFVKLNGDQVVYQLKGWITKGRSMGIYQENKLYGCGLDGADSKILLNNE